MTIRKHFFILTLTAILFATFLLMPVCADSGLQTASCSGVVEEDLSGLTPDQQYKNGVAAGWSRSTLEKAESKYEFMKLTSAQRTAQVTAKQPASRAAYAIHILQVPHFRQERSYWCGPAVVKQTIDFYTNGSISPTQTQIASEIGTTTAGSSSVNMANWLAAKGYPYANVPTATMTTRDLVNYIATGLDAYDSPPFGAVAINWNQLKASDDIIGWRYTTSGHFLNISELYQMEPNYEESLVYVVDPYGTWVQANLTGYFVTAAQYADVMTSFWW